MLTQPIQSLTESCVRCTIRMNHMPRRIAAAWLKLAFYKSGSNLGQNCQAGSDLVNLAWRHGCWHFLWGQHRIISQNSWASLAVCFHYWTWSIKHIEKKQETMLQTPLKLGRFKIEPTCPRQMGQLGCTRGERCCQYAQKHSPEERWKEGKKQAFKSHV